MHTQPPAIYGIIGNPLNHSRSPLMHNAAFKALQVDAVYKLFPIKEEELDFFFEDLRKVNNPIFGFNVTVPYKEKVVQYMDTLNSFAQLVQAVNTVVISKDRKLHGFNTDGSGFSTHLTELGFDPKGKRVSILGAGGTARSIISVLCLINERPEKILIYNRTFENAKKLIKDLSERMDVSHVEAVKAIDDLNLELADCLINTTSVGMKNNDQCLIDEDSLHKDMLVYDVIYEPEETVLLKMAKAKGAKTANGLRMLLHQGILSFQHWGDCELNKKMIKIMWDSINRKNG